MKDKQGRTYAKLADLKVGDFVVVDGDFGCMRPWSRHRVEQLGSSDDLCIICDAGVHDLSGQLEYQPSGGPYLVGLYPDGTVGP